MVLHHTGSEGELVYCSTPCLSVTIKGAEASPPLVKCDQKEATLKIVCDDDYEVTLSGEAEMAFSQYLGKAYSAEFRSVPVFFEQKRYELIVEPTEGLENCYPGLSTLGMILAFRIWYSWWTGISI